MSPKLLTLGLCLFVSAPVLAQSTTGKAPAKSHQTVKTNGSHGWFYYDDPKQKVPPPPRKLPPPSETRSSAKNEDEPKVGSVAWIRANIGKIRDRAIDHPTTKNIQLYAYVQKLMMDKSEVFANRFVRTVAATPSLDESQTRPQSGYSNFTLTKKRHEAQKQILTKLSKDTAIWFFFRSDCPYCARQAPLLQLLTRKFGFSVLPISLDAKPMDNGSYPDNWVVDKGQGRALGVTATPTLYLVRPSSNDVVYLEAGLKALPGIETRILQVARTNDWISEGEYQKAVVGMRHEYLQQVFDPSKITDPNNYQQVLKAFKSAGKYEVNDMRLNALRSTESTKETPWYGKAGATP